MSCAANRKHLTASGLTLVAVLLLVAGALIARFRSCCCSCGYSCSALLSADTTLAGAALALASLLKLYSVIALGYLALWRRWKTIGWTILIAAIGCIFTLAVIDIRVSLSFFTCFGYLQDQVGPLSVAGMVLHSFKFTVGLPSTTKIRIAYRILPLAAEMVVLAVAVKGTSKPSTTLLEKNTPLDFGRWRWFCSAQPHGRTTWSYFCRR